MPNVLSATHLTLAFQDDDSTLTAVDDASFSLEAGKTLALLGESGCGKSLTSLALMRLLPIKGVYGQDSTIECSGQELLSLPERAMRHVRGKRVGMIFQEPMTALNPVLSIGTQLAEALQQHQTLSNGELRARILELLEDVEIDQPATRLRQYPHQLSGGQKQRIVIAMALASRPDIVIADEPTTALDVTIQAQILKLLKKLQQQYHMSVLLITHDLGVVKSMADKVCVMYAGQVIETADVEVFFKQPLHPYTQQMFFAVPTLDRRHKRLQAIPGQVPALDAMPSGCRFHPRCAHAFAGCDTEKPHLQEVRKQRQVRCHLYPEHEAPPSLPKEDAGWALKENNTPELLLSVQDLVVEFKAKQAWFSRQKPTVHGVDGLSFDLYQGRTLALVGESGCGKSTTAKAVLCLQAINSGRILYRGKEVSQLRGQAKKQFHKNIQIVFQDPFSSMNPRMTVADILAEGMLAQGVRGHELRKRLLGVLEQVSLPKASLSRYPHQFSGGQKQRISIARALVTKPEILVCDEPTSALDVSVQAQILNLLKNIQYEQKLSYLFITHNMGVVSYIADDVLVMRNGKAVETGSCEELFKHPKQAYTRELLGAVLTV